MKEQDRYVQEEKDTVFKRYDIISYKDRVKIAVLDAIMVGDKEYIMGVKVQPDKSDDDDESGVFMRIYEDETNMEVVEDIGLRIKLAKIFMERYAGADETVGRKNMSGRLAYLKEES